MKWIKVQNKLPKPGVKVLVWMRYRDSEDFEWNDSEINENRYVNPEYDYKEPISGAYWTMGSAEGYIITHWAEVLAPKTK